MHEEDEACKYCGGVGCVRCDARKLGDQPVAATTDEEIRATIRHGLITNGMNTELAEWLVSMHMRLAAQHDQIEMMFEMFEMLGILPGGVPMDVHELHDRVVRLEHADR